MTEGAHRITGIKNNTDAVFLPLQFLEPTDMAEVFRIDAFSGFRINGQISPVFVGNQEIDFMGFCSQMMKRPTCMQFDLGNKLVVKPCLNEFSSGIL